MPSMLQAADYSAAMTLPERGQGDWYRRCGQGDGQIEEATKINDMFAKNGDIRPDGRMVHDMYLMQVKTPAESKYPWDYYKVAQTIPGEQAYQRQGETKCALWK